MSGILRNSLRRIVPTMTHNVISKATLVAGPPKYPLSIAEKVLLGGGMCVGIIAPMLWIIANIKHYKNPSGAAAQ
uniref:Uncharacterized protein n=1 Tax=Arion vulgaris TaxID=1028688 RepID=A0A0B6Z2R8_9EUPU